MKKRLPLSAALFVALALSASPAFACKSDYCNGSQAPTSLSQVGGSQNYQVAPPPATPSSCVPPAATGPGSTATQNWQTAQQAIASMSMSTLYSYMMSFSAPVEQYIFYKVVYNLSAQGQFQNYVLQQMFGGNQTAMSSWINNNEYNVPGASNGSFDILTGQMSYNPSAGTTVTAQATGWVCP